MRPRYPAEQATLVMSPQLSPQDEVHKAFRIPVGCRVSPQHPRVLRLLRFDP